MDPFAIEVDSFNFELSHYFNECLLETWTTGHVLIEETQKTKNASVSFASSLPLIPLFTGGKIHSEETNRQ